MYLAIINGSPRAQRMSNTEKILEYFLTGFHEGGNTSEIWRLSDRGQWEAAKEAYLKNERVMFALPLFVENVSGLMLEFLEGLPVKEAPGTKMSFLLQGGFPEASQLRCGESFLKTLPGKLGCEYGGTLIKGDMFGTGLMPEMMKPELEKFTEAGRSFSQNDGFTPEFSAAFAGSEYLPKSVRIKFALIGRFMQNYFMSKIAKQLGCKGSLTDKPYTVG